jgi:hypothetical protein
MRLWTPNKLAFFRRLSWSEGSWLLSFPKAWGTALNRRPARFVLDLFPASFQKSEAPSPRQFP